LTPALIVTAGLAGAIPAGAAPPDAKLSEVGVTYELLIAGAVAAELEIGATLNERSYRVEGEGRTTGLIDFLVRMRFSGTASGTVAQDAIAPVSHGHHYSERSRERTVKISYDREGRATVDAQPRFDPSLSRVPLPADKMVGTIDPASVFIVPAVAGRGPLDPAQCTRSVAVLDGQIRFDMTLRHLSSAASQVVRGVDYRGPVIRCNVRIKAVGGYKPGKFLDRLGDADDIEVWFAPVADGHYLVPLRLSLPTPLGRAELHARRLIETPAARNVSLDN
jgi:hypothetical protein